jgi:hypothetical protein
MKLTAIIRPVETRTISEANGEDYVQTRDALLASVPAGHEIVGAISTVHEGATADTAADRQLLNA